MLESGWGCVNHVNIDASGSKVLPSRFPASLRGEVLVERGKGRRRGGRGRESESKVVCMYDSVVLHHGVAFACDWLVLERRKASMYVCACFSLESIGQDRQTTIRNNQPQFLMRKGKKITFGRGFAMSVFHNL